MSSSVTRIHRAVPARYNSEVRPDPDTFDLNILSRVNNGLLHDDGTSHRYMSVLYGNQLLATRYDFDNGTYKTLISGHVTGFCPFEESNYLFNLGFDFYWKLAITAEHYRNLHGLVAICIHRRQASRVLAAFTRKPRLMVPHAEDTAFRSHQQVTALQQQTGFRLQLRKRTTDANIYKITLS